MGGERKASIPLAPPLLPQARLDEGDAATTAALRAARRDAEEWGARARLLQVRMGRGS